MRIGITAGIVFRSLCLLLIVIVCFRLTGTRKVIKVDVINWPNLYLQWPTLTTFNRIIHGRCEKKDDHIKDDQATI